MKSKYTRLDMIGAINNYLSKKNDLQITYIEKKTKAQLEEIVAQYDINVDEMLLELTKEREKAKNFIPELESTIKKNVAFLLDKIQMLESLLTTEQYKTYIEYCDSQNSN
jgi:hypothetical protein